MTKLSDEKFIEQLIRLTWDNGYVLASGRTYKNFNIRKDVFGYHFVASIPNSISPNSIWLSLERIIFDHEFIKILSKMVYVEEDENMDFEEFWRHHGMQIFLKTDRVVYLRQEFSCLVEGVE